MCQRRQNSLIDTARVRIVEVFGKPEAKYPRHSDRHVGVSGEVEIDLQAEAEHCEPCPPDRQVGRRNGEEVVANRSNGIGNQQLLRKPRREAGNPRIDIF